MVETDLDDDLAFSMELRNLSEDDEGAMTSDGSSGSYHPALAEQPQHADHTAFSSSNSQMTGLATPKSNAEKQEVSSEPRRRRRLNLLDLPVDILKEIVKEVSFRRYSLVCLGIQYADADIASDNSYQRPDVARPDMFCPAFACHPSYVLTVRHRLAGDGGRCGTSNRCRRSLLWLGDAGDGGTRLQGDATPSCVGYSTLLLSSLWLQQPKPPDFGAKCVSY